MILTYKAQSDFWKWYLLPETLKSHKLDSMFKYSNGNAIKVNFLAESKVCQNALIIEWFDSVGIYINHDVISNENLLILDNWYFVIKINEEDVDFITNDYYYNTRTEAITEAIKRANVIYNNK